MRNNNMVPTVIDLFCGCGGLSYGFIEAGYEVLLGIDNDPAALVTFKNNHGMTEILNVDISNADIVDVIQKTVSHKKIDIITAGPPCQGFSLTGPRKFDDVRNRLYLAVIRIVKELEPKAFLIENVPGMATLYSGKIKDEIIRRFNKLGYNVSCDVLCAADYGVPQMRKRLFFVGLRSEYGLYDFPAKTHGPDNYITCSDAISDLPSRERVLGNEEDSYAGLAQTEYQRQMRDSSARLFNHVATNHTQMVKDVISLVPEGGNYRDLPVGVGESRRFNEAWTRYHSLKPSRTIDTGHRNHFHYKYNRVPTIRENARLQSFPDSFVFYGNRTQQNRQVGNAVPPLLGYHIGKEILKYIEQESSDKRHTSNGKGFRLNKIGTQQVSFEI
jgi:DNA (cytosine-5)-methyltransferase 1